MTAEATGPGLRVADLAVRAEDGRVLLSVPEIAVAPGRSLGLRGPSGSGKSTFLFAIAGLLQNVTGRIDWAGEDIVAMDPAARTAFRARRMGIVFQDFLLFEELDPLANAALSALYAPAAERAAIRARARDGLDRLDVPMTDRTVPTLSGGERQRVAVARALSGGGDILLADEPTANLDRANATRLIDDLISETRTRGATLIAVSHDDALLDRLDQVVRLADGVPEVA